MPDDNELFQEATSTETLDKFENPELPLDLPPVETKPPEPPAAKPADQVQQREEAMVPAQRLREESEARRQAERRYEEMLARQAQTQPQQPAPPKVDIFDNPETFVQQQLRPYLEQLQAENELSREVQSRNAAIRYHGGDKVREAYKALEEGIATRDPLAVYVYQQARSSYDPYDTIMQWHQQVETLKAVGSDPKAYRAKTEEELLSDPTFLQKAMERARSHAASAGNNVARPVRSQVSSPSLGDIGSGVGSDSSVAEPTDEQLFRAATTARRR